MAGFRSLRRQLDELGYYQPLVVDAIPLVEALVQDLLLTTHNLKMCREKVQDQQLPASRSQKSFKLSECHDRTALPSIDPELTKLEIRVADLELLNKESHEVIQRQQNELQERSRKILKLEHHINRARFITQSDKPLDLDAAKPRFEATRMIKPGLKNYGGKAGSDSSSSPPPGLNVAAMYETRNKQLESEVKKLKSDLGIARNLLQKAEKQWSISRQKYKFDTGESREMCENSAKSSYMVKLLNDNNALMQKLAEIERHSNICFHGKKILPGQLIAQPLGVCCCGHSSMCEGVCKPVRTCCKGNYCNQDIRSMVQKSHADLHEFCSTGRRPLASTTNTARHNWNQADSGVAKTNLQGALAENKELSQRVSELLRIRDKLKERIRNLEKQQEIMMKQITSSSSENQKVDELISYIEAQRDVYKNKVESLLGQIDPNYKREEEAAPVTIQEVAKPKESVRGKNQPKVIGERPEPSTNEVSCQVDTMYSPTNYQTPVQSSREDELIRTANGLQISEGVIKKLETKLVESEKKRRETEIRLEAEKMNLEEKLSDLKRRQEEAEFNKSMQSERMKRKVLDEKEMGNQSLQEVQRELRNYQKEIGEMMSKLDFKDSLLIRLSDDKDALQEILDNRTLELEEVKKQLTDANQALGRLEAFKTEQELRLKSCISEIHSTQLKLKNSEAEVSNLKTGVGAEKNLVRELRKDNMKLKDELVKSSSESDGKNEEIVDLRAQVQRYIKEVKRVEELVAAKEKERIELLDQYRSLSTFLEKSESLAIQMNGKASQLELQLATRTEELRAAESRLTEMEKDLIELSLANENYKSQLITLTSRVDHAESELKTVRSQNRFADTDFDDFNRIASDLAKEKTDLQVTIAEQAREIELLQGDIAKLRNEVLLLTQQVDGQRPSTRVSSDNDSSDLRKM